MEDEDAVSHVRSAFGAAVRRLRQEAEWSQKDLATQMSAAGFTWRQTTVTKVEAGERPVPVEEVVALARIFDATVDSLVRPVGRNPLSEWIDRAFRRYLAAERELATRTQEYEIAKWDNVYYGQRLSALQQLQDCVENGKSLHQVIHKLVYSFMANELRDILTAVGYDHDKTEQLIRGAMQGIPGNWAISEDPEKKQKWGDLIIERIVKALPELPQGAADG